MKPPPLDYCRPNDVAGALQALGRDAEAVPIAGGQSLLPMLGLRVTSPSAVVNLARLPELRRVEEIPGGLRVGAALTHAEIEDGKLPDATRGMLPKVASGIAYRSVRNFGTIGGAVALADPAADWPVCLAALNAVAVLAGAAGTRRVAMGDFVLGPYTTALEPGEIIAAFEIPALSPGESWGWRKLARKQGAYAHSIGAVVRRSTGMRVVLGANGDRPLLLNTVSETFPELLRTGGTALREAIARDIAELDPGADSYRLRCHVATVERAVQEANAA